MVHAAATARVLGGAHSVCHSDGGSARWELPSSVFGVERAPNSLGAGDEEVVNVRVEEVEKQKENTSADDGEDDDKRC